MGAWKYRYRNHAGIEIHEGYLKMDEDDRVKIIERIQELRIALHHKGFMFIDAAPIDNAEQGISRKLANLRSFKKPSRFMPQRRSFYWIFLVFLTLFATLWLLVN